MFEKGVALAVIVGFILASVADSEKKIAFIAIYFSALGLCAQWHYSGKKSGKK